MKQIIAAIGGIAGFIASIIAIYIFFSGNPTFHWPPWESNPPASATPSSGVPAQPRATAQAALAAAKYNGTWTRVSGPTDIGGPTQIIVNSSGQTIHLTVLS